NYWTVQGATTTDELGASPIAIAKIDGAWTSADTDALTILGWTTDNDNYIKIYTTDLARHDGKWDNMAYRRSQLFNNENYFRIDGVQIDSEIFNIASNIIDDNNSNIYVSNNIIRENDILTSSNSLCNLKIWNNILYNGNNTSYASIYLWSKNASVYNNTIYNDTIGIRAISGIVVAKNNLVSSTTNPYLGTFATGTDYNATDLADDIGEGSHNLINQTFNFISTASGTEDFHLASNDTGAKDLGADLSNDSYLKVIDDIDGQGRIHSSDIGADETAIPIFRSVGPSNTTALDTGASGNLTIEGLTATFATAVPDNVGVGDVIQYDSDNDGTVDALAFIHKRSSSTEYKVLTASGTPATEVSGDADWSIFRAYTSLSLAEEGTENTGINASLRNFDTWSDGKDLVTSNEQWNIACYGDAVDTTYVTINDWTTGEYNYIKIYTPVDSDEVGVTQRHSGKWDDNKYRLEGTVIMGIYEDYVKIDGLQSKTIVTGGSANNSFKIYTLSSGNNKIDISNNIIVGIYTNETSGDGIRSSDVNNNVYIYNNIIYGFTDPGWSAIHSYGTNYVYNNTIYDSYQGIFVEPGGLMIAKNNITQNCTNGYRGTFDSSSDNNISDVDQTDANDVNATFDGYKTVKFIDLANNDFHLAPDDTVAIDAGTSTPGDSIASLQNDIDGDYRTQWDIGADEAAVEFIGMVTEDDIGDNYSTLASWETGMQTDLTATSTRVFSISGLVGTVSDISSITGVSSGETAEVVHVSTTTNQILLENITGDFTDGEQLQVDGANYVTITNLGNPAIVVAKIDGAWSSADNSAVTISGWETGEYNYVKVYTTDSARHDGKWDDGKYRLEPIGMVMSIYEPFVRIDGLQMYQSTDLSARYGLNVTFAENDSDIYISNNIIKGTGNFTTSIHVGINIYESSIIWNNVIYGFTGTDSRGIWARATDKTHYIFNNTIYNSTNCIERLYATVIAKNNITQNCTDGFVDTFSSDSDNNISDLAGDAPGDNSKNSATVAFIDVDNSDFHLALSDTVARNAGTSSVVDVFDTPQRDASTWYDIDGTSRGGAFDIGADEAATEFVSTIMESGGDYDSLFDWEAEVNSDLMASGTLVYSGSITGSLANGNSVTLYRSGVVQNVIGTVVATTSSQILLENIIVETSIYSVSSSQIAQNGDEWRVDASNLWTVSGTGDQLGAPVIATAKIDGAWSNPDNTAVTIDGWETGVGNYIKIYTTDSARHNGKWSDVDYRLETIITAIVIQENYFKADGLQMKITNTDIRDGFLLSNLTDTSQMTLSNNIIKSVNTTGRGVMINSIEGNNHVGFIFNNIFINYPIGIYQNEDQYTLYAYNNTVYNATSKGFYRAQGTFVAKNNITQNCADGFVGTFTNSDFNLSDIAGDAPGSNSQNGATVTFVSTSTEDFHLAQADTSARKKGVNLTSDTNLAIVDDIDGEERPWPTTGLFDIGADQFHGQEVVIGGSPDSTVDLDNGLVGHWTFNEGSGNTVHDKSGNGNDGAWNGTGEHWEDIGRFGTGGKFNGDDDYVLVDDSDSLDTPSDNNAITICAWVNPDLLSYKDEIVTKQNDVSSDYSYGLKVYGAGSSVYSGSIRYSSSCDGSTETTYNFTDKTFSTGVWTNICVVSDGSIIKAYVDASQSSNTYTPLSCIYENAVDLTFGATAAFNGDFDGKIDEVRIYNRALSQREIAELYNQGKASSEWHFRNNLNETGTLCKLGQCKNLTGNGDYSFTTGYLEESITSLSLSGAGYASLADDDYFDIASTSDFSWLATIKTSDTGSSTIISKRTNNSASNAGYLFGLDYGKGDGIPYFEVSDGTNEFSIYGSTNIADNKWHTIITVFDEDSSAGNKIYIDGVNSTGGSLGTLGFLGSLGNSVALNVGRNNDDTGLFTGSIDRIAFLPYALTRNDVLRENANSYSVQIGQQTKDTSSGVNYDPFGGAPPVAWWKLNEMSGSVAKDYASSSLNGTWNGTGNHFKNGKVGMGGNFNGTDDYVDLGSDPIIKTTQFTIGAWAKMSGQGGGSDGDNIIFEQRDASTGDNHSSIILFSEDYSSNEVCFKVRSSVGLTDSASYATPANYNEWHYYIGVVDSSFIYLYIDGVEVSKVANTQTGNYITGLDFIDIGRHRYSSSNAGMFNGCIDDVKIYDYARTQAQIAWDYNRGKPIAHWKFDEASSGDADGATLIDSSDPPAGGAYNGTGSSTGSGLDYVSGKFGSALDFDGADDFVGIGDLDVVDNASQLSVCSWVYHDGLSWDQYIAMNGSDAGFRFFKDTVGSSARTDMYRIIVKETGGTTAYIESESDTAILQQWRHVCFTYTEDSLNGLRLYINGLEDPNSPVDTSGIIDIDSGVEEFAISSNSGNSEFNGKIDDVRVYNYVLSESMIKEVYNNGRVRFGE
ncbi:hypothetical protein KAI92_04680, partial [Candidatus Parcubacteria bacterium]|nr:hypothetical protein [Candidatus Parcubacteria bacterium]